MGCIFFEGFNYNDTDHINLESTYWSGDYTYTFTEGRTYTSHIIPSRSSEDNNLSNNKTLWLSGFPAITGDNSAYGLGLFISQIITNTSGNGSNFPYRENLLSAYDGPVEIFKINTAWMAPSGIALELEQNGSYTTIPLFYNPIPEQTSTNTELLLHFDGGTLSEHLADYSSNDLTVSLDYSIGANNYITNNSKFGNNAHNFNDNTSNGINIIMNKEIFDGDFTVEYWVKPGFRNCFFNIIGYRNSISRYEDLIYAFGSLDGEDIYITMIDLSSNNNALFLETYGETMLIDQLNYHHFAIVRSGDIIRHYMDGSLITVDNANTYIDVSANSNFVSDNSDNNYVLIGIGYDYYSGPVNAFTGSESSDMVIDELRISSAALYDADFSSNLPTAPFTNNSRTNNANYAMDTRTYTIATQDDRRHLRLLTPTNQIESTDQILDLCNNQSPKLITSSAIYLELFGHANDGTNPATTGTMHIKADGVVLTEATGISISGFNNLNRIAIYGTHYASGQCDAYSNISLQPEYRIVDDMYISSGPTLEDVNLGASVRILRLNPSNNTINQWQTNIDTDAHAVLQSNDDQTWISTDYPGAICLNNYDHIPILENQIVDGVKLINTTKSDFYNEYFSNIILSGTNASLGPYISLGGAKNTEQRYFTPNTSFHFVNPITNQNWSSANINNLQLGVIKGAVAEDCEANGGYIIGGAGDEDANGIYCYQNTTQQSVSILANNQQYYNTKNNGYYLLYTASVESWQIVNDNLVIYEAVFSPVLSSETTWTVADNGIFPPPNNTAKLLPSINPSDTYTYNSQQSIDFIP
jgi:hypothetical protein